MANHKITGKELVDWRNKEKVLFASSPKEAKTLYLTLNGIYEVRQNGKIVGEFMLPKNAVDKYNSL